MVIDASRQIAKTLYFSLRCVDCLQSKALNPVVDSILKDIYNVFQRCVDLAPETLTGQSLPDDLFTDYLKSD